MAHPHSTARAGARCNTMLDAMKAGSSRYFDFLVFGDSAVGSGTSTAGAEDSGMEEEAERAATSVSHGSGSSSGSGARAECADTFAGCADGGLAESRDGTRANANANNNARRLGRGIAKAAFPAQLEEEELMRTSPCETALGGSLGVARVLACALSFLCLASCNDLG